MCQFVSGIKGVVDALIDFKKLVVNKDALFFNQTGSDSKILFCLVVAVNVVVSLAHAGAIIITLPCNKFISVAFFGFPSGEDDAVKLCKQTEVFIQSPRLEKRRLFYRHHIFSDHFGDERCLVVERIRLRHPKIAGSYKHLACRTHMASGLSIKQDREIVLALEQ